MTSPTLDPRYILMGTEIIEMNMSMREKQPAVYILASRRNGTLYIGVTSDLAARIAVHRQDLIAGFTSRYRVHMLVYYQHHPTMADAIVNEKRLKKFRRAKKIELIEAANPAWRDLYDDVVSWR